MTLGERGRVLRYARVPGVHTLVLALPGADARLAAAVVRGWDAGHACHARAV
jgi:hypothetical protein